MASYSSPESMWIKFFSDAGLPSGIGATYALTFTENRIQMNMLLDLNNEYLKEMGISCTGDVIAILRHAKLVHEKTARDRVLGIAGPSVPIAAVSGRPGQPKATTPATRMLEHYTRNSVVNPAPTSTNAMVSVKERLGAIHITGTKRKVVTPGNHSSSPDSSCGRGDAVPPTKHLRQSITQQSVHAEDAVTPTSDSKSSSQKKVSSSVFSRLGLNDDIRLSSSNLTSKITITVPPKKIITKPTSSNTVFARLGGKGDILRRSSSDSNEPLKYEGILKGTPPKKKVVLNRTVSNETVKPPKKVGTMRADEEPVSVREKLPISLQQRKSVKFSPHVDFKVIEKRPTVNVPSQLPTLPIVRTVALSKVSTVVPVAKVIKRTPLSVSKSSVKMRLGKTDINKRSKSSVFGRLGITSRM